MIQPYQDFCRVTELLSNRPYTFAKTMAHNPHFYTVRKTWERDEDFVFVVEQMRKYGWVGTFGKTKYTYFDCNGWTYWTMGASINLPNGEPYTIIINRKRKHEIPEYRSDYDPIAESYEQHFSNKEYTDQDKRLNQLVRFNSMEKTVLDIGCGTGLFTEINPVHSRNYTGIDPSLKMLEIFKAKAANFSERLVHEKFENFYHGCKYDLIVSLYGSVSYIDQEALPRILKMLNPEGGYFLMFFKQGYTPVTHEKFSVEPTFYRGGEKLIEGANLFEFDNYVIATNLAINRV